MKSNVKQGGLIERLLEQKKCVACKNCGNMVIISDNCWGCVPKDKFIMPDYPPHIGNTKCEWFEIKEKTKD